MHYLLNILAIAGLVLGFGFVVFIHELGHFLAARWVGIRCEQFAVGFGHAVLAWRKGLGVRRGTTRQEFERRVREHLGLPDDPEKPLTGPQIDRGCKELGLGETEYRWNYIPLGGYVKMVGQDDMDATATSDDPRSFSQVSVSARALVISAGVIFNVILASALFVVLFLYGFHVSPTIVGTMQSNCPAAQAGIEVGDEILQISGWTTNDFNKLTIWSALMRPDQQFTVKVKRASGRVEDIQVTPRKGDESTGSFVALGVGPAFELQGPDPAIVKAADLKRTDGKPIDPEKVLMPGDVVTSVNGQPVTNVRDVHFFDQILQSSDGSPIRFDVARYGGGKEEIFAPVRLVPVFAGATFDMAGLTPRTMVVSCQDKSPAQRVMKPGDVIVAMKVGAETVSQPNEEEIRKRTAKAGADDVKVSFLVLREKKLAWTEPVVPDLRTDKKRRGMGMGLSYNTDRAVVSSVLKDSPAAAAGVPANSLIQKINGREVNNWVEVRRAIIDSGGKAELTFAPLDLETDLPLASASKSCTLQLTPAQIAATGGLRLELAETINMRGQEIVRKTTSALSALEWGVIETRDMLVQFYVTLHRIGTGSVSADNLMGPLGIFWAGSMFAMKGLDWLIWFLAMISANLAVVNFLPIPIMDGGLFVVLMIEKLRGKPLNARIQGALQYVGLTIILGIFLYVSYNDILRMF
ncbi:MAG: site-2 protease family protein [Tepidisphaerales bacterium]